MGLPLSECIASSCRSPDLKMRTKEGTKVMGSDGGMVPDGEVPKKPLRCGSNGLFIVVSICPEVT